MAKTSRDLERLLRRLRPLLRIGAECGDSVPNWQRGFGPEGLKYRLIGNGWKHYQELEDVCEEIAEQAEVVGLRGAETVASDLLYDLARDARATEANIAQTGFRRLSDPPVPRIVLQPIYGAGLQGMIDVCGVAIRPFDSDRLAAEFADEQSGQFMRKRLEEHRERTAPAGIYAIARITADAERAFTVARERAGVAVALSPLSRDPPEQHWWMEWSAAFVPAAAFSRLSFTADGSSESMERSLYGLPLQFDCGRLSTALPRRPGLSALDSMSPLLRRDRSKMQGRLMRSATLLAASLEGDPSDRFIRRWMALEALIGREPGEVTERVSERLAVLVIDEPDERVRAKAFFRTLYMSRSDIAHGRSVPLLKKYSDAFKLFAFGALERAASFGGVDEDEFFRALEVAKFRGSALTSDAWLGSGWGLRAPD